ENGSTLDLVRGEDRRRPRGRRGVDEREILLAARLDPGGDAAGLDPGDGAHPAIEPLDLGHARPRSWIDGRRAQAGPLVPAEHHVEVLYAVVRTALAEVVDGRQTH